MSEAWQGLHIGTWDKMCMLKPICVLLGHVVHQLAISCPRHAKWQTRSTLLLPQGLRCRVPLLLSGCTVL